MLYLDHAATTPPYDEVIDSITEVMRKFYGNPSSLHQLGVEAERLLIKAKELIASTLAVKPSEIVLTSGGTESNNLAVKGVAYQHRGRGNHLITSQIEHPSVLEVFRELEKEGFRVTYLPVDDTGQVIVQALQEALCDQTILVSIMHVNNEMGRIQPIHTIGKILAGYPKVIFHVDAVQSIGKLQVKPHELGVDLMSASAHKFRGPKGVGFLFRREGLLIKPQLIGGGQEQGLRSGTENVPLIVGMAKALRMTTEHLDAAIKHKYELRQILKEGIRDIPALILTGAEQEAEMAPHIVHFCFPGMKSEVVVHALEKHQYYISSKSACSSEELKPSDVLTALGYDRDRASSGLRVSFAETCSIDEMKGFVQKLQQTVQGLQGAARIRGERKL
ncbi:cysteine desulfurase [Paenibacillus sp. N1-5-1-14]|uniref:cysteine desulfurase family protein n=1 Tax=Paenibacillus radicibacter TaxID=2972488 RepID=UPI002158C8FD|nr:cysteine desulfurase family protein [Paenibacillus radicibacter]MCR8641954.1 cysteine desulfurase [Paenibacillus radicibacter]